MPTRAVSKDFFMEMFRKCTDECDLLSVMTLRTSFI